MNCFEGDALYAAQFLTRKGRFVTFGKFWGRIRSPSGANFRDGQWKSFGGRPDAVLLALGTTPTERLWGNICIRSVAYATNGRELLYLPSLTGSYAI